MNKFCIKKSYLLLFFIFLVLVGFFLTIRSIITRNLSYNAKAEIVKTPINKSANYIIGCNAEKIKDWPFVVSIYRRPIFDTHLENYSIYNNHICGGTLINDKWILTAAHCFYDSDNNLYEDNIKVAIGYADLLNDKKNVTTRRINKKNIFIHPGYLKVGDTNWNDIALVKFSTKVSGYSNAILPTDDNYESSIGHILGWGYKSKDPNSPDYKISANLCGADVIFSKINDRTFTLKSNSTNSAFKGDSGGPLITNNQYISGIISKGYEGSDSTTIYVDVYQYLLWITSTMEFFR